MKAVWNHISGRIPDWASSTNPKVFTSHEWFEATDPRGVAFEYEQLTFLPMAGLKFGNASCTS